jgi:hypothetical protein
LPTYVESINEEAGIAPGFLIVDGFWLGVD